MSNIQQEFYWNSYNLYFIQENLTAIFVLGAMK